MNAETHELSNLLLPELGKTRRTLEHMPGKVSGRLIVRGTRIVAETIVQGYKLGESVENIQEGFPAFSKTQITRLIEFAQHSRCEQS